MSDIPSPKSFRIDNATSNRFKDIAGQLGANQQDTLAKLIDVFEMQKGKEVLAGRKADIDKFECYSLMQERLFLALLEENQTMEEGVRAKYDAQLSSKDAVIADLQKRVKDAGDEQARLAAAASAAAAKAEALEAKAATLEASLDEKTEQFHDAMYDKDELNKALLAASEDLKKKLEGYTTAKEKLRSLEEQLRKFETTHADLEHARRELEDQRKKVESQKEELERKDALIDALKDAAAKEQEKNASLANRLKSVDALTGKNVELKDALASLQTQLEDLKNKHALQQQEHGSAILALQQKHQDELSALDFKSRETIDRYQEKYFALLNRMEEEGRGGKS